MTQPTPRPASDASLVERPMLLREAVGTILRERRHDRDLTLRQVARASAVALGYLSEVERGTKEVSSELLAAITATLGMTLPDLLVEVAKRLEEVSPTLAARRALVDPARPAA